MDTRSNRITIVTHVYGTTRYVGLLPEFSTPKSRDLQLFGVKQTDDEPRAFFADGEWKKAEVYDGDMLWLYTIEQGPIDPIKVVDLSAHFLPPPALPLMARMHIH